MNKQQLSDLQARLTDVLKASNLMAEWSVQIMDAPGVEIDLGINSLTHRLNVVILLVAHQFNCKADIFFDQDPAADRKGLIIQVCSEENGGITDESNAKYDEFEAYQKDGGELSLDAWLELPENKHLDV